MRILSIIGIAIIGLAFLASKPKVSGEEALEIIPPNCVSIDQNLFIDRTEITNFHWLEYLYWNKRVFGKNSEQYNAALPDTNVWSRLDASYINLDTNYLRHPAFRNYPVVGISQQQAIDFGKWREDRVMEYLLIKNKYIDYNKPTNIESAFSMDKLLSGEYPTKKAADDVKYRVRFRLPSESEWNKAFEISKDEFANLLKKYENNEKKISTLEKARTNVNRAIGDSQKIIPLNSMTQGALDKDDYFIYLDGNVSEWLIEQDSYIGTNFTSKESSFEISTKKLDDSSSIFVGARFVSYWEAIN